MTNKPSKPKHYTRDYTIIFLIALGSMLIGWFTEIHLLIVAIPLLIILIVPQVWFSAYLKEVKQYNEAHLAAIAHACENGEQNVNKNIAEYEAKQKQRRANASWWQFWV